MAGLNLIPAAGNAGVFSTIRDPRVLHLSVPHGCRVVVLQVQDGIWKARAGRLIREFEQANDVHFITNDGSVSTREDLGKALSQLQPQVVFLPHPDAQDQRHQLLYQAATEFLVGKIGISYETPDMNSAFNLYVLFDEAGMNFKMRCLKPFKSQLERVRFDLAAKFAARAALEELKGQDLSDELRSALGQYSYAERFVLGGFSGAGADFSFYTGRRILLAKPEGMEFDSWNLLCGRKAAFYSPHHDDLEIPAAFIMSELARRGTLVHNLVLSTGKEGVMGEAPWIQKLLLRSQELADASRLEGIVPLNLALVHDAPEARPRPEWRAGAEMIVGGFLQRFNPRVIFLPLAGDQHPDHQLTHELVMETAKKAFADGHWSEGVYPNVVFYSSPWYSGPHGTNAYYWFDRWTKPEDDAARYTAQVSAIVGTELAMNRPGTNPPKPGEFGGKYAERFLIQTISRSS